MRLTPLLSAIAATVAVAANANAESLLKSGPRTAPGNAVSRAREALVVRAPEIAGVTLEHAETLPLSGGKQAVKFLQTHGGLPVAFGGASVISEADGSATETSFVRVARDLPNALGPTKLPHDAAQAASDFVRASFSADDARLVLYPSNGTYRLAWAVYRGVVGLISYAPFVVVDAEDGAILAAFDASVHAKKANLYQWNPKKTPNLVEVTLDIPDGATTLENDLVVAKNCIDEKSLVPVSVSGFNLSVHSCVLKQKAVADANGDFVDYKFVSDTDPEDTFAEVQMFHHVNNIYKNLMELGMPELKTRPIPAIVNLRVPQGFQNFDLAKLSDPNLPLQSFDNAFFSPPSPLFGTVFQVKGAAMFFFQGTQADFSYDGDVAFHEFTHAAVDRTIQLIGQWHPDSQGATAAPGGMNEGLADYFSSALTGDPAVGEYASKGLATGGAMAIRVIDNQDHCLNNLSGEVHADSTFFSGALWAVRTSLAEDKRKGFDTALMGALVGAPTGNVGYEDVTALFVASLKTSTVPEAAAALEAEFAKRGQGPTCKRVFEYTGKAISGPLAQLANTFAAAGKQSVAGLGAKAPYAPGLFQIHAPVTGGKLTVKFATVTAQANPLGGGGTAFTPAIITRFDKDPISFKYEGGMTTTAGEPVVPTKTGSSYAATIDVPAGATDVYAMIVNQGDQDGMYRNITFTFEGEVPAGTGGAGGGAGAGGAAPAAGSAGADTAGTGGSATTPAAAAPASDDSGGCGCAVPQTRGSLGWAAFALVGLGVAARRRRR